MKGSEIPLNRMRIEYLTSIPIYQLYTFHIELLRAVLMPYRWNSYPVVNFDSKDRFTCLDGHI
ncbi:hypothetical protein Hanom_Chr06g00530881 [Helianthus anomalus]